MKKAYYSIAGVPFMLSGDRMVAAALKIPSLDPFYRGEQGGAVQFCYQESHEAVCVDHLPKIQVFSLEEKVDCVLYREVPGNYIFVMTPRDTRIPPHYFRWQQGENVIKANLPARSVLLRFAIGMAYCLSIYSLGCMPIHASCSEHEGQAVLFLGPSGTGKSTHSDLWKKHIPGVTLLNDDQPILKITGDKVMVYGSPWSGKTRLFEDRCTPLAAMVRLNQAPHNKIRKLSVVESLSVVIASVSSVFYMDEARSEICFDTLSAILDKIPVYYLDCLPDKEAALLSYRTVFEKSMI